MSILSTAWPQAPYNEATHHAAREVQRRVARVGAAVFLATMLYAFGLDVLSALTGAVGWKAIAILVLDAVLRAELFITGHGIHVATMLALGVLTMAQYLRANVVLYGMLDDIARGVGRPDAGEIAIRLIRSATATSGLFRDTTLVFLGLSVLAALPKYMNFIAPSLSVTVVSVVIFIFTAFLPFMPVSLRLLPQPPQAILEQISNDTAEVIREMPELNVAVGVAEKSVILAYGVVRTSDRADELKKTLFDIVR